MINMAILGFGTVGSGVAKVLTENAAEVAAGAGEEIRLKYIVDVRDMPDSPFAPLMVKDFSIVEQDPEVGVVVETIGGCGVALAFTRRALQAGKHVVTSNKQLVAEHGVELLALAKEKGVNYFFEASVGGGIPLLRPLFNDLSANRILSMKGILNGTTNYILTQMIENGVSCADALADAQAKGFAERDPAADIEGHDACRKISILSDLCFGRQVDPESVSTEGITGVSLADVEYAHEAGYRIKLLGRALRRPDGRIHAYVAPHLLPESSLLANVKSVMNGIVVHGNAIGEAMFYGAGAGKRPTASAVAADVIDAAKHLQARKFLGWDDAEPGFVADTDELVSRWYVRLPEGAPVFTEAMSGAEVREKWPERAAAFRIMD